MFPFHYHGLQCLLLLLVVAVAAAAVTEAVTPEAAVIHQVLVLRPIVFLRWWA